MVLIAAMLISIFAPGNAVRQQTVGEASVIKGFVLSVVYAVYSMANATTVPVLLVWVFIAPMLECAEICRNAPGEDVVLPALTAKLWVLTYLDITEDPTDWKNVAMTEYYGNASVRLQTES